jgi:hypothetical protein
MVPVSPTAHMSLSLLPQTASNPFLVGTVVGTPRASGAASGTSVAPLSALGPHPPVALPRTQKSPARTNEGMVGRLKGTFFMAAGAMYHALLHESLARSAFGLASHCAMG